MAPVIPVVLISRGLKSPESALWHISQAIKYTSGKTASVRHKHYECATVVSMLSVKVLAVVCQCRTGPVLYHVLLQHKRKFK